MKKIDEANTSYLLPAELPNLLSVFAGTPPAFDSFTGDSSVGIFSPPASPYNNNT